MEGIAEKMASEMREVSVAEFFEKNRHLLGYENIVKSLLTVVKEAVDNSLDATTEAGILPDIKVVVKEVGEKRYRVRVEDNGPGIVPSKVPYAFGKLLYGSKFHRLRQSRGVQGLGIHGAVLYAQLTTGKPAKITTSTGGKIHDFELMINVKRNEPLVISHKTRENPKGWHGVIVELEVEGKYVEGSRSIPEYLKQTAMANPYAKIIFIGPKGRKEFKRVVRKLPKQPKEIKPHPYGVELGLLRRMLEDTKAKTLLRFLMTEFSRVGKNSAKEICKKARIPMSKDPHTLDHLESERLHRAMQSVKLKAPPTNCLSPLGEKLLSEGIRKETGAEFVVAVTRQPSVYRGNPFQVEVAIAYGGELREDTHAKLYRLANKVPLLYNQSDCVITKTVSSTDFRRYGLSQSQGQLPVGPVAILVHFASVWVPFTSEGKQAIANYPEIAKEIKLALQDAGRKLASYIRKQKRIRERMMRREMFERYVPIVSECLSKLTGKNVNEIERKLREMVKGEGEKKVDGTGE